LTASSIAAINLGVIEPPVNKYANVAAAMAIGRVVIGAAALLAPGPTSKLLGFPRDHDNATARLMGRLFGVRDVALGVLVWRFKDDQEVAPWAYRFNAAIDAGDAASIAIAVAGRQGIDRGALSSAVPALGAAFSWTALARGTERRDTRREPA
jgi:hypothetical protein